NGRTRNTVSNARCAHAPQTVDGTPVAHPSALRTLMGSYHTLSIASKQHTTAAEHGGWIRCWFRRLEPLVVGSEGEAMTNSSCRPLAEVLAWSGTSTEEHVVGGEEEEEEGMLVEVGVAPRLDAGEGENGDDAATASRGGGAARREGTRVGDGTPAGGPGPATTGEPLSGAALRDMSPAGEVAILEGEVMNLEFPNLEDGTGSSGEKTIDNAVKMLVAKTGRGIRLRERDQNEGGLWTKKSEEEDPRRRNRWSCVSIKSCHGGKPRKRPRVEDASARRNSKSRKISTVGCNFHVGLWWASNSATPRVSQAS
ncbi:unnamed protein product, partial [Ectocarpus sp. 12 AP-2014]